MTAKQRVLAAVFITSFMGPFMGSSLNIAIPSIADSFAVPAQELSWVSTIYLLGSVAFLVPFGRLADILGRRRIYAAGSAAVAVTTFLGGAAPSVPFLLTCRLLQGVALALIFSTSMAMLVASHAPGERGRVIGYSALATYTGLSLGPVLGGLITQYLGWRLIFYISAAVNIGSFFLMYRVKEEWFGKLGKFDYRGSCLYTIAAIFFFSGLSCWAAHPVAKYVFLAGIVFFACFFFLQRRAAEPLLDMKLFDSTIFRMSNLAALLNYSATFAITFLLSLYLQLVRGMEASSAGVLLLLQPLAMAALSPTAGALSDRHEPRIVASVGMAVTMAGLGIFALFDAQTSLYLIGANLLFIGIGFALFSSPNSNAIMGAVKPDFFGVASSILAVMRISGQTISMSVVTMMLALYTLPPYDAGYLQSFTAALHYIFAVLSFTCLIGVGASLARGDKEA